ncbi:unnamed protein product [Calicophoron daubneyi]|uniref:Uncharacterized protein n=1 Tax=Calicophoron daubneyi TaxID=300641 RepID=A0AAV2T455_CALDB
MLVCSHLYMPQCLFVRGCFKVKLTNIHTPKSDHSTVKKKKDKNRDSLNSSLTLKPSHPPGKVDHGVKRACPGGEDSDEEEQVFHKRPRVQSTDLDAKRMRTTDSSQVTFIESGRHSH